MTPVAQLPLLDEVEEEAAAMVIPTTSHSDEGGALATLMSHGLCIQRF